MSLSMSERSSGGGERTAARTWTIAGGQQGFWTVGGPELDAGEVVEVVELSRYQTLEAALKVAADDLGKAANQFASIRASQRAGHTPEIVSNPGVFERKEACARAALASAGAGGETADE